MPPTATVVLPTQHRPDYLDVALASIVPQARAAGVDVLVVDDGPTDDTKTVTEQHGAAYLPNTTGVHGLNAARNLALDHTTTDLVCFVDDDVRAHPGWLDALLTAAADLPDEVGVLTGPIVPVFEDHDLRMCGREGAPITFLDAGPADTDVPYGWGANMTIRRSAIDRAGRFDASRPLYGDEAEWQDRLKAAGGRVRYIAAAGLDHRRAGDDSRLTNLMKAARARGVASRRHDVFLGRAPSLTSELKTLAGCLLHAPRYRCANGLVMAAHSLGRVEEANDPTPPRATPGVDDFLSGRSGTVGGLRGHLRRAGDALDDLATAPARRSARSKAKDTPAQRVLLLGVERPDSLLPQARAQLIHTHHHVTDATGPLRPDTGKFEHLNRQLVAHDLDTYDWVLVLDDDVVLPPDALDVLIDQATAHGLKLAQPAHRRHSHAAWPPTRRAPRSARTRTTNFVEIGPVTLFHRDTFATLLPFPDQLKMGWGLDTHWAALARVNGWHVGVVDAVPMAHTQAPAGSAYSRDQATQEAQDFLKDRPYLTRDEIDAST